MTNETYSIDIIPPEETDIVTRLPCEVISKLEAMAKSRDIPLNKMIFTVLKEFVTSQIGDVVENIVENVPGLYDEHRIVRSDILMELANEAINYLKISSDIKYGGESPFNEVITSCSRLYIYRLNTVVNDLVNIRACTIGLNVTDSDLKNIESIFNLYKEYIKHIQAIDFRTGGGVYQTPDSTVFMCVLLDTIIKGFGHILDATAQLNSSLMKELNDYVTNGVEVVYVDLLNNIATSRGVNIAELILIEYENLLSRSFAVNVVATNSAGSTLATSVTIHSGGLALEEELLNPLPANQADSEDPMAVETSDSYRTKLSRLVSTLRYLGVTRRFLISIINHRRAAGHQSVSCDWLIALIERHIEKFSNIIEHVKYTPSAIKGIDFEKLELFDNHLSEVGNDNFNVVWSNDSSIDPTTFIDVLNSIASQIYNLIKVGN